MAEPIKIEIASSWDASGATRAETDLRAMFEKAAAAAASAREKAAAVREEIERTGRGGGGMGEMPAKFAAIGAAAAAAHNAASGFLEGAGILDKGQTVMGALGDAVKEWARNLGMGEEKMRQVKRLAEQTRDAQRENAAAAERTAAAIEKQKIWMEGAAAAADAASRAGKDMATDAEAASRHAKTLAEADHAAAVARINAGPGNAAEKERQRRAADQRLADAGEQLDRGEMVAKVEAMRKQLQGLGEALQMVVVAGEQLDEATNVKPEQYKAQKEAEQRAREAVAAKEKEILDTQLEYARRGVESRRQGEAGGIDSAAREREAQRKMQDEARRIQTRNPGPGEAGNSDLETMLGDAGGLAGRIGRSGPMGRGEADRLRAMIAKISDGTNAGELDELAKAIRDLGQTLLGRREGDGMKTVLREIANIKEQLRTIRANDG